jgi:hypothetical protein
MQECYPVGTTYKKEGHILIEQKTFSVKYPKYSTEK